MKKGEKSHEKKIDTFENLGWKVSEKRFSLLASSASEFTLVTVGPIKLKKVQKV